MFILLDKLEHDRYVLNEINKMFRLLHTDKCYLELI